MSDSWRLSYDQYPKNNDWKDKVIRYMNNVLKSVGGNEINIRDENEAEKNFLKLQRRYDELVKDFINLYDDLAFFYKYSSKINY